MPDYRLYFIGPDGRFILREDVEADDDAAAIKEAERRSDGRPTEVWQIDRLVTKVVKSKGSPTPGDLLKRFLKQ